MITRLKQLREVLGLNQTNFAKHLCITQTAYSMIENGNRSLADKYIKVICSDFGVNERWLRDGTGEMFAVSPLEKDLITIYRNMTGYSQECLLKIAQELLSAEQKLMNAGMEQALKNQTNNSV